MSKLITFILYTVIFWEIWVVSFELSELSSTFHHVDSLCASCHRNVWRITSLNGSFIHRFFDTSPFSPSGRYLGVTRLPVTVDSDQAQIVVIDLKTGRQMIVAESGAWASQLGAQVQWGARDDELIFNDIVVTKKKETSKHGLTPEFEAKGVVFDMFKGRKRYLDCPVYQVSPDGTLAASPCLTKIHHTQIGYGITAKQNLNVKTQSNSHGNFNRNLYPNISSKRYSNDNKGGSSDDGLFIINIASGDCRLLVSLAKIADFLQLNGSYKLYSFHTKWSPDQKYILFVVRQLVNVDIPSQKAKSIRISHAIVVKYDPSDKSGQTPEMFKLISWSSHITKWAQFSLGNGNHPNWIPDMNSHRISMNIGNKFRHFWDLVVFDIDPSCFSNKNSNNSNSNGSVICVIDTKVSNSSNIVFRKSTGHPLFHPDGRHVILDAGRSEIPWFEFDINQTPGYVPIRRVDTKTGKEEILMNVYVGLSRDDNEFRRSQGKFEYMFTSLWKNQGSYNKEMNAWRCDVHPAWSKDYRWLAMNGRDRKLGYRQVYIIYMGNL